MKTTHEIRDPIHVFIRLNNDERLVLNSPVCQRLRDIHQLSLTYLLYPGASHKRFEHSLGVMELASRVFDVITSPENIHSKIRDLFTDEISGNKRVYWRCALRMAALCHDVGHLPFSHASESLLPAGWNHERLTIELINSSQMVELWEKMTPPLRPEDIAKLAVGPKDYPETLTPWETILSEIIVGDAFGVDRMDYLLRDSHHTGVAYGKFDHYRLIDTMRLLPSSADSTEPSLGIEEGGLHSAESLLLARYFMFQQVYLHPVRRIYDVHLADFLSNWLDGGVFPTDTEQLLAFSDARVLGGIRATLLDTNHPGNDAANRITNRSHYKVVYSLNTKDHDIYEDPGQAIYQALCNQFGTQNVKRDHYGKKATGTFDFPLQNGNGEIISAYDESQVLPHIPIAKIDYVYANPELRDEAKAWLNLEKENILNKAAEEAKKKAEKDEDE